MIPGYAAKLVEDTKFYADKTSERPVARIHGGRHTLAPFAAEDGGRLGAHVQSFLRALAERAVHQGRRSRPTSSDPNGGILRGDGASHAVLHNMIFSHAPPPPTPISPNFPNFKPWENPKSLF